ncbi:DEAD/DEAH box helicase [Brachybacterium sp. P6-10-X1]|uniref:DEAD/DEAH box helicase n=1 Tax=Brachybacterium sp. P6-10-X1 TaxID=1903186 RepID=UPI000971B422|nr:DEAD/DEAH box helicase [Brachybacterium sp. P6-10-X1]APX32236.1 DEAD/DEAH box helicase [Brachybacterium sp. P6-10-X1]
MPILTPFLPETASAEGQDAIVDGFMDAQESVGRTLYPHQEEALLAIAAGDHVIAATPTGSGKTTIAYSALFAAMARGQRSYYTAPIKALVSEKFFDLVAQFGAENVGMMTGDSSVNHDAPIIVCTAEIFANHALRDGPASDVGLAVMDEFHFYGDSQRGWAWQVPLVELPDCQFVLMSATLGDVSFFVEDLEQRTQRAVSVIDDAPRPVPLDFRWSLEPLPDTISTILADRDAPVYIVHFTQKDALEQAQSLLSQKVLTTEEKGRIREIIGDFRFSRGFGQILSKLVREGIGVHHAGMLPKYRRLVEKLAQSGLLKVICGTDTLGVGINVPIRTVLLTGLAKFDGSRTRLLNAREFHQIAGRAGRAGFDTIGHVVVQAPIWTIEFERERAKHRAREDAGKVSNSAKKRKKEPKPKIPDGAVSWSEANMTKLVENAPESLRPHLKITAGMELALISRPGDAIAAGRHLIMTSHQTRTQKLALIKDALAILKGLRDAEIIEVLPEPDHLGRRLVLVEDLQLDFTMNQPLAPFAIAMIDTLDEESQSLTMDTVSIIEAILEDPRQILLAQQNAAKGELLAELKADGVEYTERMAQLDEVTWPKPLEEDLEAALEIYAKARPWVRVEDLSPKSVVREIHETGQTFSEFVQRYGLQRSEGIVLRYLSDAYQALRRTIPQDLRTEELEDLIEWLGVLVRGIDSSLLDEWEALSHPEDAEQDGASEIRPSSPRGLSAQTKVLRTMVRAAMWQRVEHFAFEREQRLAELDGDSGWDRPAWAKAMDAYYDTYDDVGIDGPARSPQLLQITEESKLWRIRQVLADPEGNHDWAIEAELDLEATDEAGEPVLEITHVGDIADR